MKTNNPTSMLKSMVHTKDTIVGLSESMGPDSIKSVNGRGTSPATLIAQMSETKAEIKKCTEALAPQFAPHAGEYVDMSTININQFGEIERTSL